MRIAAVRLDRILQHAFPDQYVAGHRYALIADVAAPGQARCSGVSCANPHRIDHVRLPVSPTWVAPGQRGENVGGAMSFAQQS